MADDRFSGPNHAGASQAARDAGLHVGKTCNACCPRGKVVPAEDSLAGPGMAAIFRLHRDAIKARRRLDWYDSSLEQLEGGGKHVAPQPLAPPPKGHSTPGVQGAIGA